MAPTTLESWNGIVDDFEFDKKVAKRQGYGWNNI